MTGRPLAAFADTSLRHIPQFNAKSRITGRGPKLPVGPPTHFRSTPCCDGKWLVRAAERRMTVPMISPQWLRKGKFEVKALSPSVMWPPTFGETPMSAVVSGSAPRAIGRTARLAFPLLIEFPDGISNPKRTRPNAHKGLWESRIVSEKLVNPLSRHTKKLSNLGRRNDLWNCRLVCPAVVLV
jgi:hypothetical protein